jgi:hypothetical protein
LSDKLSFSPEILIDIGTVRGTYFDFGVFGNAWGRTIKGSIGLSIQYSVLKTKK